MKENKDKNKSAILEIERLPLIGEDAVSPHPKNPRKHPTPGSPKWNALKRSLQNKYFDPLVVNKRNNKLVSGHLRRKILIEEGFTEADMVVVDVSEDEHVAMMIAANQQQGDDDIDILVGLLDDMDKTAIEITGFSDNELTELLRQSEPPDDFPKYDDESIETEYKCPKCGYEWSGKPQ